MQGRQHNGTLSTLQGLFVAMVPSSVVLHNRRQGTKEYCCLAGTLLARMVEDSARFVYVWVQYLWLSSRLLLTLVMSQPERRGRRL